MQAQGLTTRQRELSPVCVPMDIGAQARSLPVEGQAPGGGKPEERMSFTMVPVGLAMRLKERAAA